MLNKYGIRRAEKEALKCVKRETADRMLKAHAKKRGGMDEIRQLLSRRESASTAHGVLFGGEEGVEGSPKMRTSISARCENHQGQRHQSAQEIRK